MIDQIEKSIKKLSELVKNKKELTADEALKYTQAVGNLANARACITTTNNDKK